MIAFSDTYENYNHLIEEGRPVIVQGTAQLKEDEYQFYVYEICDLSSNISKYIEKLNFILKPSEKT